ncbi:MAG: hypothetical protein QW063_01870 [Candidatus Nanoarchaeia archaeon]
MAAGKQAKGKKKWFTVLAPVLFGSKELAEIPAYESAELQKRFVEVTGQMLTGLPKDINRKYLLRITEIKGDKVATIPAKYYVTESYIQRSARKYKDRFIYVLNATTKDEKQVRIKLNFFNAKKLHHSVRGEVLRRSKAFIETAIKELDSVKVFEPATVDKISTDLRKALTGIYPIDKIFVAKLALV